MLGNALFNGNSIGRWIFHLRNWKLKPRLPYVILIKHFQTASRCFPSTVSYKFQVSIFNTKINNFSPQYIKIYYNNDRNFTRILFRITNQTHKEYY